MHLAHGSYIKGFIIALIIGGRLFHNVNSQEREMKKKIFKRKANLKNYYILKTGPCADSTPRDTYLTPNQVFNRRSLYGDLLTIFV